VGIAKSGIASSLGNQSPNVEVDRTDQRSFHRTDRNSADRRPERAALAVAGWRKLGCPTQNPIVWPQNGWIEDFPEFDDLLAALPNPLGREDVRACVSSLPRGEEGAVAAFVACMAWGYGRTGYGRSRTRKVLESNSQVAGHLDEARMAACSGGLEGALNSYSYLAGPGRMRGLGPAFGTKFTHFHNREALILDRLTADWFREACGIDLRPTEWCPSAYREYLAYMGEWAETLGVRPHQLEEIAFTEMSRRRGNQWAE